MILFVWTVLALSIATVLSMYIGSPACLCILQLWKGRAHRFQSRTIRCRGFRWLSRHTTKKRSSKFNNGPRLDYSAEKLQLVFVSDSTDGTKTTSFGAISRPTSVRL